MYRGFVWVPGRVEPVRYDLQGPWTMVNKGIRNSMVTAEALTAGSVHCYGWSKWVGLAGIDCPKRPLGRKGRFCLIN